MLIVGDTPLVELKNYRKNNIRIFAKLEYYNPCGSIKDRIGKWLVEDAISKNKIKKDTVIVEASSGNTGIGIANACREHNIKCLIIAPENTSKMKIKMMKMLNAEIILINGTTDDCIKHCQKISAENKNYLWLNQFDNKQCITCHEQTTAREIEKQLKQYTTKGHNILVCAMGTTGTIMGCSKYLKPKGWEIVGVQPLPNCKIEGLKNLDIQRRPKIYDEKAINWMHQVTDKDAWDCVKELCKEGIFGGFSSGAAFHIAKQWWKFYKLWSPNNYVNIVVIIHDTIRNYL